MLARRVLSSFSSDPGARPSRVTRERIRLRRFAGPGAYAFDRPIRVAHLTDQHVGRVTPWDVQREAIERTNAQQPDLVALTGDFVCHSQLYLDQLSELVSLLRAPAVAVMGNHDHWSGVDEVIAALGRGGAEVLRNQHTSITVHGQRLQVVGLDDGYTGHADKDRAVKGLDPDVPSLALSHIAEEADGLWRRGVPFVLSGHTHGGQVTLARLHEIALGHIFGHKYVHGLYGSRERDAARNGRGGPRGAVYVSAGIGAAVMPFRVGDRGRREVAIFDLGLAPGSIEEHHSEQPPLPGRKPSWAKRLARAEKVARNRERRQKRATQVPGR